MNVLVIALHKDSKLISASFETVEAARKLGGELTTALLAADPSAMGAELASRGGGSVLCAAHPSLGAFTDTAYAGVLSAIIASVNPDVVLAPSTFYGKALTARLAARQGGRMVSDITGLTAEGGSVSFTRPCFGGSVVMKLAGNGGGLVFATVRPKIFPESKSGTGNVSSFAVTDVMLGTGMTVKESRSDSGGKQNLAEADVIVSAGRGIKGPEHVGVVKELADAMGAAFGASRAVVDAGWVPYANQVGQTGRTVNPKLYVAVGISGAIQHLVGMQSSQTIVAINKDKDAPIFNIATYGIVGDLFELLPALTRKFKQELRQ